MTQDELGLIFGVSGYTVSGWENNNDNMPLQKMVKFSNLNTIKIRFDPTTMC